MSEKLYESIGRPLVFNWGSETAL